LPSRWEWIADLFGDDDDYRAALYAYYVSLTTLEYAEKLRAGQLPKSNAEFASYRPEIPPVFENASDTVKRRGYQLAVTARGEFRELWTSMKLGETAIKANWQLWIGLQKYWLYQFYPLMNETIGFERLIYEILE
jgi:hypothetical protein